METSRQVTRVSGQQLEILWEFLITNRDLATGHNRSLQAKEYSQRKWREIAETLNSQGNGADKDWRGWSKYWVDHKAKIKSKLAAIRSSHARTGGGPSTDKGLTKIEEKFLQILGQDFGQGLPGVRVEPLSEPLESGAATVSVDVQDSPASQSILTFDPGHFPRESIPSAVQDSPVAPDPPIPTVHAQPHQTPSPPRHPGTTPAPAARYPRRRRLRREPPMSQETARRAIVRSVERYVSAMERIADTTERMEYIFSLFLKN